VRVIGPGGERSFPLRRLYTQDGKKPLSLRRGEILREIFLPPPSGRTIYLKWRHRGSLEFPIVSLALNLEKNGDGTVKGSKIFFSALGSGPVEASGVEKMLKGSLLDDETIEKVSSEVLREISPMRTSIHSPAYKRKMAGILLRQALEEMKK
jgi:CO/xanthine dehydrogenase FAD-binding subunit